MKKITTALFIFLSIAASAQTAQEVLAKFYDATGGKAAWDSVQSYSITRSFVAGAATDYDVEVNVVPADESISRRKSIMKRDFFYVVDKNDGWLKIPMGSMDKNVKYTIKDLSDGEKVDMQQEIKDGILPLIDAEKKGYQMSYEDYKKIGDKTLAKITLTRSDATIEYFFDKETGLISKEIFTTPKLTETWEHTKYAETESGIKYPKESNYLDSKVNKKTTVSTTLSINQPIDSVLFIRK